MDIFAFVFQNIWPIISIISFITGTITSAVLVGPKVVGGIRRGGTWILRRIAKWITWILKFHQDPPTPA